MFKPPFTFHTFDNLENSGSDDAELFQGDMILQPMERLRAELGMDVDGGMARGATFKRLWPNGIVYYEINKTLGKVITQVQSLSFLGSMQNVHG